MEMRIYQSTILQGSPKKPEIDEHGEVIKIE